MRTAQEWSDLFDGGDPEATKNIATIQADALRTAADIAHGCECFGGKASQKIDELMELIGVKPNAELSDGRGAGSLQ